MAQRGARRGGWLWAVGGGDFLDLVGDEEGGGGALYPVFAAAEAYVFVLQGAEFGGFAVNVAQDLPAVVLPADDAVAGGGFVDEGGGAEFAFDFVDAALAFEGDEFEAGGGRDGDFADGFVFLGYGGGDDGGG